MSGRTSAASKNKYIAKAYDRINFVMPKGRKEEIKQLAEQASVSASEWINNAITEKMQNNSEGAQIKKKSVLDIKDLSAYARSAGMTEEEYIRAAVTEKMERQDAEYTEEVTRVKEDFS